jgi:hypothetical protein
LTGTGVANAAIVPARTRGDITVFPSNDTDLVVDIDGYFAPPSVGGLSLYTFTPCRAIDTRKVGTGQPFTGTLHSPVNVSGGPMRPTEPGASLCHECNGRSPGRARLSDALA